MLRSRQYPEIAGLGFEDGRACLRRFSRHGERGHPGIPPSPSTSRQWSEWSSGASSSSRGERRAVSATPNHANAHLPPPATTPTTTTTTARKGVCEDRRREEYARHEYSRTEERPPTSMKEYATVQPPPHPPASLLLRSALHSPSPHARHPSSNEYQRTLGKSCPDLDRVYAAGGGADKRVEFAANPESTPRDTPRDTLRPTQRTKKKRREPDWSVKPIQKWRLDEVLLWLQDIGAEDVASLVVGYDMQGEDVLLWSEESLETMGVSDKELRKAVLTHRNDIVEKQKLREKPSLFDIITECSGDQVMVVETPLTARDIIVSRGKAGCLEITKVNGAKLPLCEKDCLLEINGIPGEQFKSGLMLTKLISDVGGAPIRFVILRKTKREKKDSSPHMDSSSGVSSSSPVHG